MRSLLARQDPNQTHPLTGERMKPFKAGIGIIEGFFGKPWTFEEREVAATRLQSLGGSFFTYAPKGDPFLRKRWREELPTENTRLLQAFGKSLHEKGLQFGIGLSPYELYRSFDKAAHLQLEKKLIELERLGADHLALLFDDMRGDIPNLAELQIEIISFIQKISLFKSLSFCPTYYSTDPILDKVFGQRPPAYLEQLGNEVDPEINFYWTGEKVCSTEYPDSHLKQVEQWISRKPLLWDNYPVNDGYRMCKFLHLRPFRGRGPTLRNQVSGHAINPMNQARLSLIPIQTLFQGYAGENVDWMKAAINELGQAFALQVEKNLSQFQDQGLDRLENEERSKLIKIYQDFQHPAALEITSWLKGETIVSRELVLTQ